MNQRNFNAFVTDRRLDAAGIKRIASRRDKTPLFPLFMCHVYVHLDIQRECEYPRNSRDALRYLKSVAKVASTLEAVAREFDGLVLEVQGSTIHVGLLGELAPTQSIDSFADSAHTALDKISPRLSEIVLGWRFTADAGKTLLVPGLGVHQDLSFVSLGNAANRPAKHLYRQLSISESNRQLKRYYLAKRSEQTGDWLHRPLRKVELGRTLQEGVKWASETAASAQLAQLADDGQIITAMAVPIAPPGSSGAPSAERPECFFGWVMRADLDGFTKRVEECHDHDTELLDLGEKFLAIMDEARKFVAEHKEYMVQLPWAGDNFTAAVVFKSQPDYNTAREKRIVEHVLDFDRDLREALDLSDFNGWAYGPVGTDVHGGAIGNVFIGAVEFDNRRFLVGSGQGFARSQQVFADIEPDANEMTAFMEDYEHMSEGYKKLFKEAEKPDGAISALFRVAPVKDLSIEHVRLGTNDHYISITNPTGQERSLQAKPYCDE